MRRCAKRYVKGQSNVRWIKTTPSPRLFRRHIGSFSAFSDQVIYPTFQPDHLILIVDLEATCCDQGTIPVEEMEIIEIGACWARVDGTVLNRFKCFVRPTLHPCLTPFCKNLLGIEQEQVDRAETLTMVASNFREFVQSYVTEEAMWGSWGAFDRNQLDRESRRLGLSNPIALGHVNLKRSFAKVQRIGKQVGMRKALELASLPFQGTHHRALDDALNIVCLLPWALPMA